MDDRPQPRRQSAWTLIPWPSRPCCSRAPRPGISATYLLGEQLGIFTHGRAGPLNPEGAGSDPTWPAVRDYLVDHYDDDGDNPFWDENVWYRIDPDWMVAYSADPAGLLGHHPSV